MEAGRRCWGAAGGCWICRVCQQRIDIPRPARPEETQVGILQSHVSAYGCSDRQFDMVARHTTAPRQEWVGFCSILMRGTPVLPSPAAWLVGGSFVENRRFTRRVTSVGLCNEPLLLNPTFGWSSDSAAKCRKMKPKRDEFGSDCNHTQAR